MENPLQLTCRKETIISKQQKVIKHLIKKGLGSAVISAGGANNRKSSGGDTNQDNRLPLKSSSLYARRTGEASDLLLLDTSSAPGTISPGGSYLRKLRQRFISSNKLKWIDFRLKFKYPLSPLEQKGAGGPSW